VFSSHILFHSNRSTVLKDNSSPLRINLNLPHRNFKIASLYNTPKKEKNKPRKNDFSGKHLCAAVF